MDTLIDWVTETHKFLDCQATLSPKFQQEDVDGALNSLKSLSKNNSNMQLKCRIIEQLIKFPSLHSEDFIPKLHELFEVTLSQITYGGLPVDLTEEIIAWINSGIEEGFSSLNSSTIHHFLSILVISLKDNYSNSETVYLSLAGSSGVLIKALECQELSVECHCEAFKALQLLSYVPQEVLHSLKYTKKTVYPPQVSAAMQRITLSHLRQLVHHSNFTEEMSIIAASCITILYNLVICTPHEVLGGLVLNTAFPFAFHGLPDCRGVQFIECERPSTTKINQISDGDSDSVSRSYTNRNRRKRLLRKKPQPFKTAIEVPQPSSNHSPNSRSNNLHIPNSIKSSNVKASQISLKPQWLVSSSTDSNSNKESQPTLPDSKQSASALVELNSPQESNTRCKANKCSNFMLQSQTRSEASLDPFLPELSHFPITELDDGPIEKGAAKFSLVDGKVRRLALILINSIIYNAGHQNKFSFWPQMMCQTPSLMTSAMRDPSICVRMAALQVINTFLIDSQDVLKMAVDEKDTGPYSTLGRQLGTSIRELHRCLALCLLSERVSTVLVRILKTIELLIENINYANFKPGLLTKIITHVKYFLKHKGAPVVQANAFSVMVSLLMKRPHLPELKALLLKYQTPAPQSMSRPPRMSPPSCEEGMPDSDEVTQDILSNDLDDSSLSLTSEDEICSDSSCDSDNSSTTVSWIIHRCVDSLLLHGGAVGQGMYLQVQIQSLKVLNALVSEHLFLMKSSIPLVQHIISACGDVNLAHQLRDSNYEECKGESSTSAATSFDSAGHISYDRAIIVEHSFLLLSSLLGSIKYSVEKKWEIEEANSLHSEDSFSPEEALQLWLWALQGPLQPLLDLEENTKLLHKPETVNGNIFEILPLKPLTAAASVLNQLFSFVLKSIGETWFTKILTTVSFLLKNIEHELHLCGIRIIGFIVPYISIWEHLLGPKLVCLASELSNVMLFSKDRHINKDRITAAWFLANTSSALITYKDTWERSQEVGSFMNSNLVLKCLNSCILGCQDKDKIKPHAVRAIGNFVSFMILIKNDSPDLMQNINKATTTLIECSISGNDMKTRWNACHALGTIVGTSGFKLETVSWRIPMIVNLSQLVENFKNFKVRIQACITLCQIRTRSAYSSEYLIVWKSYLKGLDGTGSLMNYQAIHFKDELIYQICIGICHLIRLLESSDLEALLPHLSQHSDILHSSLKKSNENLTAEKASCFVWASEHISQLEELDALTVSQQSCLSLLGEIFKL